MPMNEQFPLALPEGTILAGQYSIEKVLGQGGFGITYKANDHKTGQKVAVKEFFPDTLAYREVTTVISYPGERSENFTYGKEGFLQEAQTLAEFIGNENIVRIHSYFEENGTAYFVMDYIEGISFDDYLKNRGGKISCEEAKQILIPVMDALGAVHSKGIVHRDVTPDNIYITNDGTVKLLDFGAARYSLGDKSRSLDVILKHGFAPKEQYTRRGKQGPFTDIYSLGATFYFAITGKRPPDSVDRLDEDELIPPSNLGVQITDYQERAILQALSVQPSERFESMAVFKQVLLNESVPAQIGATNQIFFNAPQVSQVPPQSAQYVQQPIQYTQQQTAGGVQTVQAPVGVTQAVQNPVGVTQAVQPVQPAQPVQPVQPAVKSESKVSQFIQKAKTAIQAHQKLSIGIAAAAVICIIVAIASGGGSSSNDDIGISDSGKSSGSRSDSGKSSPSLEIPGNTDNDGEGSGGGTDISAPGSEISPLEIIGNLPQNIRTGGYFCKTDDDFFRIKGNSIISAKNGYIKQDADKVLIDLNYDDGYLYYVYGRQAYMYDLSDGSEKPVPELESCDIGSGLYVSKSYFYYIKSNSRSSSTLYRVSRETGEMEEAMSMGDARNISFCGEWIYIASSSLKRVRADDFSSEGDYSIFSDSGGFTEPVAFGDYVYVLATKYYAIAGEVPEKIVRYNADLSNPEDCTEWQIGSLITTPPAGGSYLLNILDRNAFLSVRDNLSQENNTLYHFVLNDDGTIASSEIVGQNVSIYTSVFKDGSDCILYNTSMDTEIIYDSNGNKIS